MERRQESGLGRVEQRDIPGVRLVIADQRVDDHVVEHVQDVRCA